MATDPNSHCSLECEEPIIMGRIAGPYGVRGWVRVVSYTEVPERLLEYAPWYLRHAEQWQLTEISEAKRLPKGLLVRLTGCEDRETAAGLAGSDIGVNRSQLPPAPVGEYYWSDLIGLMVQTLDGRPLGTVEQLIETGANDVLVVRGERERLIPFVSGSVINRVDLETRIIWVDWDPDF